MILIKYSTIEENLKLPNNFHNINTFNNLKSHLETIINNDCIIITTQENVNYFRFIFLHKIIKFFVHKMKIGVFKIFNLDSKKLEKDINFNNIDLNSNLLNIIPNNCFKSNLVISFVNEQFILHIYYTFSQHFYSTYNNHIKNINYNKIITYFETKHLTHTYLDLIKSNLSSINNININNIPEIKNINQDLFKNVLETNQLFEQNITNYKLEKHLNTKIKNLKTILYMLENLNKFKN